MRISNIGRRIKSRGYERRIFHLSIIIIIIILAVILPLNRGDKVKMPTETGTGSFWELLETAKRTTSKSLLTHTQ